MQLSDFSRQQILGSCILLFILEFLFFSIYNLIKKRITDKDTKEKTINGSKSFSIPRLLLDATLLAISFLIINYIRRDFHIFSDDYLLIAYIITGLWFLTSIFTRKYEKKGNSKNIWYFFSPYIKTLVLTTFFLVVIVFFVGSHRFSRFELFGTLLVFGGMEIVIFLLLFILKKYNTTNKDFDSINGIQSVINQKDLSFGNIHPDAKSPAKILKNEYLVDHPNLNDFISKNIALDDLDEESIFVLNTRTYYNILHLKAIENLSLFINLHRINDFRWLNRYFIILHQQLKDGGYIVGNLETITQYKRRFFQKMPNYLAKILYLPDFIFRRVFPKLSIFKQIYFFITDGYNRTLSKAEAFGRLQFCGFSVIAEREIDYQLYFVARKVKTISIDENPSYSPIINLPRIGLNGEIIQIYKFRTMYPYSEYLQEYVYSQSQLDATGKFNCDFRMSSWGKILRKLWIDELPQIYNWIRGDVTFVGVRALSEHYLSLYPKDLQQLRTQFKPGLIPPYYADIPKNFEGILESERRYLQRKKLRPFTTDLVYFRKAFINIVFKGARSG